MLDREGLGWEVAYFNQHWSVCDNGASPSLLAAAFQASMSEAYAEKVQFSQLMPCQACFVSSSTRHAACVHAGGVSVRSPRAHAALQSKPTRGQDVSSRAHGTSSTSHPPRQDKQDLWVA